MSKARGTHSHNIKWDIFAFMEPSDDLGLGLNIPSKLQKEERGLNDKSTARFLIPRNLLDRFEKDPIR